MNYHCFHITISIFMFLQNKFLRKNVQIARLRTIVILSDLIWAIIDFFLIYKLKTNLNNLTTYNIRWHEREKK